MEQKISSLPIDLTSEILFRLPAKSVGRFYCLSKLWLSITADPRFIKSLGTTRPSLLLCSIKGHHIFVSHQSSMIRSYASSQPFHLYLMCCTGQVLGKPRYNFNVVILVIYSLLDSHSPFILVHAKSSQIGLHGHGASHQKLLSVIIPAVSHRCINVVFDYQLFFGTIL
ncbi:hypothetical protein HID58_067639 [Brassica napus]|uniref:F-box domain-containing protein n=1 Tax=Brassica napus TaxID=3708 RepID=A0ABQ7ZJ33_BRANA|nr:hypothetical protein HID58_067639 [Brassica napus]